MTAPIVRATDRQPITTLDVRFLHSVGIGDFIARGLSKTPGSLWEREAERSRLRHAPGPVLRRGETRASLKRRRHAHAYGASPQRLAEAVEVAA